MDFDPKSSSVVSFISRFRYFERVENAAEVLRILPRCLKGDALEWHNGLPNEVKEEMDFDLDAWERELIAEWGKNPSEAWAEA